MKHLMVTGEIAAANTLLVETVADKLPTDKCCNSIMLSKLWVK